MLGTKPLPLFAASLLTYPLALSYVAVLILIDFFPLRRFGQGFFVPAARRVWLEKVPFVLVFGLVFAATLWARGHGSWQWERPVNLEQFGLLSRVMQAFYIWAYYLWKPLLPFDLSPVYTTLGEFDPLSLRFVLSLALVVVITLILFWKRRQWPGLFALWLCHLVVLVPFLGLTEYPPSSQRPLQLPGQHHRLGAGGGLFAEELAEPEPALEGAGGRGHGRRAAGAAVIRSSRRLEKQ